MAIEPKHLLKIIQVVHSDIVGVRWDQGDFEIIDDNGSASVSTGFRPGTLSKHIMEAIQFTLEDNNVDEFEFIESALNE